MKIVQAVADIHDERRARLAKVERKLFQGNTSEFARQAGVKRSTLQRVITGDTHKVSIDLIDKVVQNVQKGHRRVSRDWLEHGNGGMLVNRTIIAEEGPPDYEAVPDALVHIPLVTVRASAGPGEEAYEERVARFVSYDRAQLVRDTGVSDPRRLSIVTVTGNSMEPTLRPGDRVLVAFQNGEPIHDGAVYVFVNRYSGVIVKRVEWADETTLLLKSDNPDAGTIEVDVTQDDPDWRVVGRVVKYERSM